MELDQLDLSILEALKESPQRVIDIPFFPIVKQHIQQLTNFDKESIIRGRLGRLEARELIQECTPEPFTERMYRQR